MESRYPVPMREGSGEGALSPLHFLSLGSLIAYFATLLNSTVQRATSGVLGSMASCPLNPPMALNHPQNTLWLRCCLPSIVIRARSNIARRAAIVSIPNARKLHISLTTYMYSGNVINVATAYLTNYFRCLRHRVISQSATSSAVTSRLRRSGRHLTGGNLVDILRPIIAQR